MATNLRKEVVCPRVIRSAALCLVLLGTASSALAEPGQSATRPSLCSVLRAKLSGAVARVKNALHPPRPAALLVSPQVFEEIIRNTELDRSMSAEQRAAAIGRVQAAQRCLQAANAFGARRPVSRCLTSYVASTLGLTSQRAAEQSAACHPLRRETYDANFNDDEDDLGTLELSETKTETKVAAARRAHDAIQVFADLNKAMGLDLMGIVQGDHAITTVVRFGHIDNAGWYGPRNQVTIGGGGEFFDELTQSPDIAFHELGHACVERVLSSPELALNQLKEKHLVDGKGRLLRGMKTLVGRALRATRNLVPGTGFVCERQSGALDESLADIYAAMANQFAAKRKLGELTEKDWLISPAIMSKVKPAEGHPIALRNMLFPGQAYDDPMFGADHQVDHMDRYNYSGRDNWGVHKNSGIPSRAFANATMEVAKTMPGATSWETTGYAWLHAVNLLGPNATFQEAADATCKTAQELFPDKPAIATAIRNGWISVGITPAASGAARKN